MVRIETLQERCVIAFDLDHTLVRSNSSFSFGVFLYRQGVCPLRHMICLVFCYAAHQLGLLSVEALHKTIFRIFFYGKSKELFCEMTQRFLDSYLIPSLYPPVYEKLQEAQRQGNATALFSSGPDFLVEAIAARLAIDHWLATTYAIDSAGYFASVVDIVVGKQKAVALQMLVEALQCHRSIAYSDSCLDIPFLQAASHAVVVLPAKRLKRFCRSQGWGIIEQKR